MIKLGYVQMHSLEDRPRHYQLYISIEYVVVQQRRYNTELQFIHVLMATCRK